MDLLRCRTRCLGSLSASKWSSGLEDSDAVGLVTVGLPMGRCILDTAWVRRNHVCSVTHTVYKTVEG